VINRNSQIRRWANFLGGLLILGAAVIFFMSGLYPPGICGKVLRHNEEAKIDASPFFYGDVENMNELIAGAEDWRQRAIEAVRDSTGNLTSQKITEESDVD